MPTHRTAIWIAAALTVAACSSTAASRGVAAQTRVHSGVTTAGHVVVVMMENHSYSDIIGNGAAPYLNSLARQGVSLTGMHAVTHPSQPNYLALFSGSTHGVTDDSCPQRLPGADLGSELLAAQLSFTGYSEGLPAVGDQICTAGSYARKHVPWTDFPNLPGSVNRPFADFPADYATLPTLAFVIPNLDDDMHDGTIAQGDAWVAKHLSGYVHWAATHHSLLVVAWDEDDRSEGNQIPTIIVGAGIAAHRVSTNVTLYSLLRLLEDRYGLPRLGASATATPIHLT